MMSCKSWWWRADGNLTGTSGRDWLFGGRGNNTIDGRGGNDFIWAGRGDDTVYGGDGNDRIWSGRGDDTVYGGEGDDRIRGGRGDDTVYGGEGNDRIRGGRGDDTVYGGEGNDRIRGGRGDDTVYGGEGDDRIRGGRGDDTIYGGEGDDRIRGGRGDDVLDGGAGSDRIRAGSGDDTGIYSVTENLGSKNYYHGGRGNDLLILRMTHAQYESTQVQADLQAYDAFLTQHGNSWSHHAFQFQAFDLRVKGWESYDIQYTDTAKVEPKNSGPVNTPPTAGDDTVSVNTGVVPIQELEPSDPGVPALKDAAQVIDRSSFQIAPEQDVGNDALPRVSITGTIAGPLPVVGPDAKDVDVFAVTLKAGETLILDIDHAFLPQSPMNAQLFLMDESGKVLAENDDFLASAGGLGSVSPRDPYLEFTDSGSGGTYYVAVSAWNNDPLGASGKFNGLGYVPGDYVLNMSIENPAPDLGALVISQNDLLANDSDANGDGLNIIAVGNAVNGKVELTGSGDILFSSGSNSPGSFEYTVSDGNGGESAATVTVNGNPIVGTVSDDVLVSTSENDFFIGDDGNDTFNFAMGSGDDTIADFAVGSDTLVITDGMSVAGFQTLGNDTFISFDSGDSVLLVAVSGVSDVNDLFA